MVVSQDKMVSLTYELRVNGHEGEIVETVDNEKPLTFLVGHGQMLPKFETNLLDHQIGDGFKFKLECDEAYGQFDKNAIINLPKENFGENHDLMKIDAMIPLQDQQGNRFVGKVTAVNEADVAIDLNHPLAGMDLYFSGKITEVREATKEELEQKNNNCSEHTDDCGGCSGCE